MADGGGRLGNYSAPKLRNDGKVRGAREETVLMLEAASGYVLSDE